MRDSGAYFILQGVLKMIIPTGTILMILIESRENVFE